jgi:hypothetical protein
MQGQIRVEVLAPHQNPYGVTPGGRGRGRVGHEKAIGDRYWCPEAAFPQLEADGLVARYVARKGGTAKAAPAPTPYPAPDPGAGAA